MKNQTDCDSAMSEVHPCPKCNAEYKDSAIYRDPDYPGSQIVYDIFECGSKHYGTTLGTTQSDKCRINELTNVLKVVRRSFAHKYNAREIALIDAAIGSATLEEDLKYIDDLNRTH